MTMCDSIPRPGHGNPPPATSRANSKIHEIRRSRSHSIATGRTSRLPARDAIRPTSPFTITLSIKRKSRLADGIDGEVAVRRRLESLLFSPDSCLLARPVSHRICRGAARDSRALVARCAHLVRGTRSLAVGHRGSDVDPPAVL